MPVSVVTVARQGLFFLRCPVDPPPYGIHKFFGKSLFAINFVPLTESVDTSSISSHTIPCRVVFGSWQYVKGSRLASFRRRSASRRRALKYFQNLIILGLLLKLSFTSSPYVDYI